jgi:hypothetical protein
VHDHRAESLALDYRKPAATVVAAAVQLAAVSVQGPSRVGLGQFPNAWDAWELCLV